MTDPRLVRLQKCRLFFDLFISKISVSFWIFLLPGFTLSFSKKVDPMSSVATQSSLKFIQNCIGALSSSSTWFQYCKQISESKTYHYLYRIFCNFFNFEPPFLLYVTFHTYKTHLVEKRGKYQNLKTHREKSIYILIFKMVNFQKTYFT